MPNAEVCYTLKDTCLIHFKLVLLYAIRDCPIFMGIRPLVNLVFRSTGSSVILKVQSKGLFPTGYFKAVIETHSILTGIKCAVPGEKSKMVSSMQWITLL
jgi:hypothetical protein